MREGRKALASLLPLIWLLGLFVVFYAVQKPLPASQVLAVIRSGLDILTALFVLFLGAALGWRLLARFPFQTESERWLFGAGVGLAMLSLSTLALGLAGWFSPFILSVLAVLLSLLLLPTVYSALRAAWMILRRFRPPLPLTIYLIISSSLSLLTALAPPSNAFDALLYHLTGPRLYLEAGRIYAIDNPPLYFPSLLQMLFALALALRGDIAAQLLHFGYGLLAAGAMYLIASRFLSPRAGWWGLALLWSMPMFPLLLGWAYVDLALLFYQLLSAYAFLRWMEEESHPWLLLSGACAGFAMGVKYTAFVLPLSLLALWTWQAMRGTKLRTRLVEGVGFGAVVLAMASPWLLRNWWLVGNPVYPFLWEGRFWDGWLAGWYEQPGSGLGLDVGSLLRLPLTITLGVDPWGSARDETFYDGRSGPLLLALLPLLVISRRISGASHPNTAWRTADTLLLLFLAQFGFWTMGVMRTQSLFQARLLLPALAFLGLALTQAIEGVQGFTTRLFSLPRFLNLAMGLALGLGLLTQLSEFVSLNPLPYALGQERRDEYLRRALGPHYMAMEYINTQLPANSTIQFLWEPRTYYSQRPARPDPLLGVFKHEVFLQGSASEIARAWREEGITHVLFYQGGFDFLQRAEDRRFALNEEEAALWNQLQNHSLRALYHDAHGTYILYELSAEILSRYRSGAKTGSADFLATPPM